MLHDRGLRVNLDLMYGLPGSTLDSWTASLQTALQYEPDSVSTYFTFVDYGTTLWRKVQANDVDLIPHAEIQIQHIAAQIILEDAGYVELPNDFWSKPAGPPQVYKQQSLPSVANSLGLGAGAYGYYPKVQYFNQFNLVSYAAALKDGQLPIWRAAALTEEQSLRRDIMFSFKNEPELSLKVFDEHYGISPTLVFPDVFELLADYELVVIDHAAIRLTAKGRLVVEEIAALFAGSSISLRDRGSTSAEDFRIRKHHFASTYGRES
jgi:oxygen-independent coproporphyrinogen-3 oxidase